MRFGFAGSLIELPEAEDNSHEYFELIRRDVSDYTAGDYHSIRTLRGKNVSGSPSAFLVHLEAGDTKVNFEQLSVHARNVLNNQSLRVYPLNYPKEELRFIHVFHIEFDTALAHGGEFNVEYEVSWPSELHNLSMNQQMMSVSLSRYKRGIRRLVFSVDFPKAPSRYFVRAINQRGENIPCNVVPRTTPGNSGNCRIEFETNEPKDLAYILHYD